VAEAHRALLREKAKLARMERLARAGQLIERAEVESVLYNFARQFRDRLLIVGTRLAPAIAMQDAGTCTREIDSEIAAILDELSGESEATLSRMAPEAARERE
jgi:hypothetical protein